MLTNNNKLRAIMKDWKKEAKTKSTILYRLRHKYNDEEIIDGANYVLTICTNQPGPMIGKMGTLVDKYRNIINEKINRPEKQINKVFIKFVETEGIV